MDQESQQMLQRYLNDSYLDTMLDMHVDCLLHPGSVACATATALGVMASVAVPLTVAIGTLGNLLTAHILLGRMSRCGGKVTRLHIYLGCIALSDLGNLLSWGVAWQILARGLPWISGGRIGFIIPNVSDATCRAFRFVHNFFHALSANWFLLMTLDRLAALHLPLRCRVFRAKDAVRWLLVTMAITAAMVAPMPVLIGWHEWRGRISCLAVPFYGPSVQLVTVLTNAMLMLPPTLQLFFIAVLNILLLVKLSSRVRWTFNGRRHRVAAPASKTISRSRELAPTLQVLLLSAIYFASGMPTCVVAVLVLHNTVFAPVRPAVLRSALNVGDIGQILLLMNQSFNWVVLVWKDRRFREHLLGIVRLRFRAKIGSSETAQNVSPAGGSLNSQREETAGDAAAEHIQKRQD